MMIVQPFIDNGRSLFFRESQSYTTEHSGNIPLTMIQGGGVFSISGDLITCHKSGKYELDFKSFLYLHSGYSPVNYQLGIHAGINLLRYARSKTAITANDFYFDRDVGLGAESFLPVYSGVHGMCNCWIKLLKQVNLSSGDTIRISSLLSVSGGGTVRYSSLSLSITALT